MRIIKASCRERSDTLGQTRRTPRSDRNDKYLDAPRHRYCYRRALLTLSSETLAANRSAVSYDGIRDPTRRDPLTRRTRRVVYDISRAAHTHTHVHIYIIHVRIRLTAAAGRSEIPQSRTHRSVNFCFLLLLHGRETRRRRLRLFLSSSISSVRDLRLKFYSQGQSS